jgi:Fe-S cluster biogenesis protein NfuA
MTVALHPEATEDPLTLRWVTDTAAVPDHIVEELIGDGTLAAVEVAPGEIRTRLAPGRSWSVDGPRVRTALFHAVSATPAETLTQQISQLLTREVGPLVSSHGGALRVLSVEDDVVTLALDGTCGQCTLRNQTLTRVVTTAVRRRFPQIRDVRAVRT